MTVSTTQPTLATSRLLLRPFTLADAPRITAMLQTPEIAANMLSIPYPYEEHHAVTWLESLNISYENGLGLSYAVTLRDSSDLIGSIGLYSNAQHGNAEMGYWLGIDYWGNGYVTEAARTLLTYAFDVLNLHKVFCHHFMRNPASGRVMQKLGMTQEGMLRQHYRKEDGYVDAAIYGILRDEWLNLRTSGS
jgi:RimJ/RimL family protein N-acetyltransferase